MPHLSNLRLTIIGHIVLLIEAPISYNIKMYFLLNLGVAQEIMDDYIQTIGFRKLWPL